MARQVDDNPGDGVGDEQEGVEEAGEVEGLEGQDVGGHDDDEGVRSLDAELEPLLALDSVDDAVGLHDLAWVGVGPRADPDPMAADHHPAPSAVGDGEGRRWGRRRLAGEGEGEGFGEGEGGCGGGGGGGCGAKDGSGGVEGGGAEEEEEDEVGEAEAEDEAGDASENVEEEPEEVGRGLAHAVGNADVCRRRGWPVCGGAAVVVVRKQ